MRRAFAALFLLTATAPFSCTSLLAAEFGAGPWIKGATDIFAGVVPSAPGLYTRADVYHYDADVV